VIDVHHGERDAHARNGELLELQRAHHSRRVFDQDLVDVEPLRAVTVAFAAVRVE
jgi:hypothetical protein